MKTKILKDKWWGMRKLLKNRESRLFNHSWDIRNTSSILPIQDKKQNTSSMNELGKTAAWRIIYD
jgi:hypothetical protein